MTEEFDNDRRRTGLMLVTAVMLGAFLFSTVGYRLLRDKMKKPAPPVDTTADSAAFTRIVSLAPSTTETLYALGLGDRIVGVTDFCNYPPEARDKTRVGALLRPGYERIIELKPDLVLALPEYVKGKDDLLRLGLNIEMVNNKNVADVLDCISSVGQLCGVAESAKLLRDQTVNRLSTIRQKSAAAGRRPRVLAAIGRTVGQRGLAEVYVCGAGSFHDELIGLAGGANAVELDDYPMLSAEGIMRIDPDVIIDLIPGPGDDAAAETYGADWKALPSLSAVRNDRVYVLGGDHVLIPGPRFVQVVEDLAELLHGAGEGTDE